MTIGAALFTITVGAILAFAVTAEVAGIDLQVVGYILLAIGALGLVVGLWMNFSRRRARRAAARVLSAKGSDVVSGPDDREGPPGADASATPFRPAEPDPILQRAIPVA